MGKIAVLTLSKVWVNLASSGAAVSAQSAGRARAVDTGGEVRTYAGGRQRSVTREGVKQTFSFTLLLVTAAQVDTLISWVGQTVQVRDRRGQRFFAVYHGLNVIEHPSATQWSVAIIAHEVAFTEGV